MRIESRTRVIEHPDGSREKHSDLCLIPDDEPESQLIDLLGCPGSFVQGEVRMEDGYGQHYLLVQPRLMIQPNGDYKLFDERMTEPKRKPA